MKQTVRAYQKYIRQTPRKLRLMAELVRKLELDEALEQLKFSNKRAAVVLGKVLTQARANAAQVSIDQGSLKISSIVIEEGPTSKRWRPVSRGRAHRILKRSSHIKVILEGERLVVKKSGSKVAGKNKKSEKEAKN